MDTPAPLEVYEVHEDHQLVEHDELCAPGHAVVHIVDWGGGVRGPFVWFRCPRAAPTNAFFYCGVPAKPSPPNNSGCSWDLTGPPEAPTLSPSVNCNGVGCGWHGWLQNGITVGV